MVKVYPIYRYSIPKKYDMGVGDYENLYKIYVETKKIIKKHKLRFNFKIDNGSFETAIQFKDEKHFHPPIAKNWDSNPLILCPDLLDYTNKIIIEYDEEPKPGKQAGKLGKKGHVEESKRDMKRDSLYKINNFNFLKIWESEQDWKLKLEIFLTSIRSTIIVEPLIFTHKFTFKNY